MQQKVEQETGSGLEVFVNGEACRTGARTLAALVGELGYAGRRIATAVNGEFIASAAREEMQLAPGDRVEIVAPRQGG